MDTQEEAEADVNTMISEERAATRRSRDCLWVSVRPSVAVSVRSGVDSVEVCVNQLRAASFTYFYFGEVLGERA